MKKQLHITSNILMIAFILSGCSSKTYYAANNKNHQRFDGWQLETANHLVEINDLETIIIDLSELAKESAVKRKVYLASTEIIDRFENLKRDTKVEATLLRVTLSSSLSAESDKYYHRLVNTSEEDFDERYKNMILVKLNELIEKIADYQEEGHNDRIKTLGEKIEKVAKEHVAQMEGKEVS